MCVRETERRVGVGLELGLEWGGAGEPHHSFSSFHQVRGQGCSKQQGPRGIGWASSYLEAAYGVQALGWIPPSHLPHNNPRN